MDPPGHDMPEEAADDDGGTRTMTKYQTLSTKLPMPATVDKTANQAGMNLLPCASGCC